MRADAQYLSGFLGGFCGLLVSATTLIPTLSKLFSKGAVTLCCVLCAATSRGRLPADGQDIGMAQVLRWLFTDGSSSIAGQDAAAAPQAMSVSSLRVRTRATVQRSMCQSLLGVCGAWCVLCLTPMTMHRWQVFRCFFTQSCANHSRMPPICPAS